MNRKGFSLLETIVVLGLLALAVCTMYPSWHSFLARTLMSEAARQVTVAFNTARYRAIRNNIQIKVELRQRHLLLKEKNKGGWLVVADDEMDPTVKVDMNACPVFYPTGTVSPLCSVRLSNGPYGRIITLAITGRVKVSDRQSAQAPSY
jgi:prepilin-type N-terminal cleavage/methylation domain-containing protein